MLTCVSLLRILTFDMGFQAFYRFLPDGFKLRALPRIPVVEISPCRKKNLLPAALKYRPAGQKKERFPGIPKNPWSNEGIKPCHRPGCTISTRCVPSPCLYQDLFQGYARSHRGKEPKTKGRVSNDVESLPFV